MKNPDWTIEAMERINHILLSMDKKEVKKYKVKSLARIVQHVHQFAFANCKDCESIIDNINDLIHFLEQKNELDRKQYKSTFRLIVKHLVKKHGLIEEGTYLGQWVAIGLAIGAAFFSFYEFAVALGFLFGVIIGTKLDAKAKTDGRVI